MHRSSLSKKDIGRIGEDVACQFLVRKGFRILERNFRRACGEIDIIAEKDGILRFVEVKSVSCAELPDVSKESTGYRPEELVHPAKMRHIARTADIYLITKKEEREYQIDVVGVFLDLSKRQARCRMIENAL